MVIAIISVLAAILFPAFASAREKARQIACLSNEKQMGLAVMQYAQDNDETIVTVGDQYIADAGAERSDTPPSAYGVASFSPTSRTARTTARRERHVRRGAGRLQVPVLHEFPTGGG